MSVLNTNIRALGPHAETQRLHDSYFVAQTCMYIWFLSKQWKCCAKLNQGFWFHFLILAVLLPSSHCLQLTGEYGRTERSNCGFSCLPPFRPCIVFTVSAWLIQESRMSKKKYNGVLGCWCYSQGHCLLSVFEVDLTWKAWLSHRLSGRHTQWPVPGLESCWSPVHPGVTGILHSRCHQCHVWMDRQGVADMHIVQISCAPAPAVQSFQNTSSKVKLSRYKADLTEH